MSRVDADVTTLVALLDECRAELATAVDELQRSRAAHRAVESLLSAVLDHVPAPLLVVDAEGRVRAVTAAAERAWGARLGDLAAGVPALRRTGAAEVLHAAVEAGHLAGRSLPDGLAAAVVEEPGTGVRYAAVWAVPPPG